MIQVVDEYGKYASADSLVVPENVAVVDQGFGVVRIGGRGTEATAATEDITRENVTNVRTLWATREITRRVTVTSQRTRYRTRTLHATVTRIKTNTRIKPVTSDVTVTAYRTRTATSESTVTVSQCERTSTKGLGTSYTVTRVYTA